MHSLASLVVCLVFCAIDGQARINSNLDTRDSLLQVESSLRQSSGARAALNPAKDSATRWEPRSTEHPHSPFGSGLQIRRFSSSNNIHSSSSSTIVTSTPTSLHPKIKPRATSTTLPEPITEVGRYSVSVAGSTSNDVLISDVHDHGVMFLYGFSKASTPFVIGAKFEFDEELLPIKQAFMQADIIGTIRVIGTYIPITHHSAMIKLLIWFSAQYPTVQLHVMSFPLDGLLSDSGEAYLYEFRGQRMAMTTVWCREIVSIEDILRSGL